MKFAALLGRSTKKDYYDIYFLLQQFSLDEIMEFYKQRFKQTEVVHVLRSLVYFVEADVSEEPEMLANVTWKEVKLFITKRVDDYLRKK